MKKAESILFNAILVSGAVTPLSSATHGKSVSVLCRQVKGREALWLRNVEELLRWSSNYSPNREALFIARKYLLKNDSLVFGWYIELSAPSATKLVESATAFANALAKHEELDVPSPEPEAPPEPVKKPAPQSNGTYALKTLSRRVAENGRVYDVVEIPLPHVTRDMNVPTQPVWNEKLGRYVGGEKGAKHTS